MEPTKESIFADVAYDYVNEQVPSLADRILGFQVLEQADDGSRSAGMFAFTLNDGTRIFMPVMFVGGNLKGAEVLYLPGTDTIIPSEEKWVNRLIAKSSQSMGRGVAKDYNRLGITSGDLSPLAGRKYASVQPLYERGSPFDNADAWGMFDPTRFEPEEVKTAAARIDMRQFLEDKPEMYPMVKKAFLTDEVFANATVRFYDTSKLFAPVEQRKTAAVNFDVKPPKNSEVIRVVGSESFAPPSQMGVYDILVGAGDRAECLVFPAMSVIGEGETNVGLVVNKETGAFSFAKHGSIVSLSDRSADKVDDMLKELSSAKLGDCGFLVCGGQVTLPFKITAKQDGEWTVVPVNTWDRMPEAAEAGPQSDTFGPALSPRRPFVTHDYHEYGQGEPCCPPSSESKRSWFTGGERKILFRKVRDFSGVRTTLLASEDAKFYPLEDKKPDPSAVPAPLFVLDFQMRKMAGAKKINLYAGAALQSGNMQYQVSGDIKTAVLRRDGALGFLVDGLSVSGSEAEDMLKTAEHEGNVGYWIIKTADASVDPQYPAENPPGFNSLLGATERTPDRQVSYGQTNYTPPTLEEMLSAGRDAVAKASESGQKEVFDASGLARILSGPDAGDQARRYLSDLQRVGIDRLGRMLLLYYWQNDAFREQYGDENMREVEDSLRGAFKSLSRAVLLLLDRAPSASFSMRGMPSDMVESGMS